MKYIDLHVHSNASDGTLTPTELVSLAVKKQLAAFALTDHDTVRGITEAVAAAREFQEHGIQIQVIPGTELSAAYSGRDIHILGLMIDYQNQEFITALDATLEERSQRNQKMVKNLQNAGIDITMDKLVQADPGAVITRAHFAKYLTQHGYTRSTQEAFVKYLDSKGPYYVPRNYLSPEEAIGLIRLAGGISVLAHPLLYKLSKEELDHLVCSLKALGLAGIETFYSSNTGFDESDVRKLAGKYQLLMTGGSDFHGANKPLLEMGSGRGNLKIPYTILEELENYKNRH